MKGVCAECGDTRRLNAQGVCEWRHGCEHRQMVHEATVARLLAEMEAQDFHARARRSAREMLFGPWHHPSQGYWRNDRPDEDYPRW